MSDSTAALLRFYVRWLRMAFSSPWAITGAAAAVVSRALIPLNKWLRLFDDDLMDRILLIPLIFFALWFAFRLILVPFWMHQEDAKTKTSAEKSASQAEIEAERDDLKKQLQSLRAEIADNPRPAKREENLQKLRTFIIHLRNCQQWLSGLPDKVALALGAIGKHDDEIKAFLNSEFPESMVNYIGMEVSVPKDEHFVLGFCHWRLRALEMLVEKLEKESSQTT